MKNIKFDKKTYKIILATIGIITAYILSLIFTILAPKLFVLFLGTFIILLTFCAYFVEKQRGNMQTGDFDIILFKNDDIDKYIK